MIGAQSHAPPGSRTRSQTDRIFTTGNSSTKNALKLWKLMCDSVTRGFRYQNNNKNVELFFSRFCFFFLLLSKCHNVYGNFSAESTNISVWFHVTLKIELWITLYLPYKLQPRAFFFSFVSDHQQEQQHQQRKRKKNTNEHWPCNVWWMMMYAFISAMRVNTQKTCTERKRENCTNWN